MRCQDPGSGLYCPEVDRRIEAAAQMIADDCLDAAAEMFATVQRIVRVHAEENQMREGRM